jgi:hypothetical protein
MCTKVMLRGRLGNNLFQYALGRIIAEHHGLALICQQLAMPEGHPGAQLTTSGPATLAGLSELFPGAPLRLPGAFHETPVQSFELSTGGSWSGHQIDLAETLRDPRPRQIRLDGYFQRYEYFQPYRSQIARWFAVPRARLALPVDRSDVLINIRRGLDFGICDWTLPLSYYSQVLESLSEVGRVHVSGTGIDDAVRAHFAHLRPVYHQGSPAEDFLLFRRFRRIVLSNSTFAWWGAFLSDAEEIHAPRTVDGRFYAFTGFPEVDLHMREPRYREVPQASVASVIDVSLRLAENRAEEVRRQLEPAHQELGDYLLRQGGQLSVRSLLERWPEADVRQVVRRLVARGLVQARQVTCEE